MLGNVPDEEFARWRAFGFTHIWLMGVWTTGPKSRAPALTEPGLRRAYDEAHHLQNRIFRDAYIPVR